MPAKIVEYETPEEFLRPFLNGQKFLIAPGVKPLPQSAGNSTAPAKASAETTSEPSLPDLQNLPFDPAAQVVLAEAEVQGRLKS